MRFSCLSVALLLLTSLPTLHAQPNPSHAPGESATAAPKYAAPELSLSNNGLVIDAGAAGTFTLPVPGLRIGATDYSGEQPAFELKDGTLIAKYPSGAELQMTVANKDKTAAVSFTGVPAGAKAFVFQMHVPIRYSTGGKFVLGKKPPLAFPETKQAQIIGDGWAESFTLADPAGGGFRITTPGDYQQVQDNRLFNWPVFVHIYNYTFASQAGKNSFTFIFGPPDIATAAPLAVASEKSPRSGVIVDRYGQSKKKAYPWKVKNDEELKADIEKEKSAQTKGGPELDRYGGLAGSGEKYRLKTTGFFHVGKARDRQVLVTPQGNMFFQLGVCGIAITDDLTAVKGRENIYEWLPTANDEQFKTAWRNSRPDWGVFSFYVANWIRKYGRPFTLEEWSAQAIGRLRGWGFNSSGAFSQNSEAMKNLNFPTVAFLSLGADDGVKILPERIGTAELMDPFVPGTEEALDRKFAKGVAARANDPLLIGYFLGNEQHFETLPKKIPTYRASQVAAKGRLVQILHEKYRDIAKFNAAWKPAKPFESFELLNEEPLFARTEAGLADMQEFYKLYMDSYYSMVNRVFRKHDPNHLLIGSRLTPGTANNEVAVRAGGKYLDVVSVNYYTYPIEAGFLKQVHEWSGGRPIILSEWHYSSADQGLGAAKEVKDQKERGLGYRNYVEQSAALPFVVGSQWFIYGDQSITGRFFEGFNGEGTNTGLIDVVDRPYEELVNAAGETNHRIYDVVTGKVPAFAFQDRRFAGKGEGGGKKIVAIPKALPGLKFYASTTNWPGRPAEAIESSGLVVGTANAKLRGDFRLCWDETNLHFLIQVKDPTPQMNDKQAGQLWGADAIELFIGAQSLNQGGSIIFSDRQVLLGVGKEPKVHVADHPEESQEYKILVNKEVSGEGYVVQVSIPWKVLGIEPKPGAELLFDVAIDNSDDGYSRKQQLVWNGTAKNSGDRGAWGRARIVEN